MEKVLNEKFRIFNTRTGETVIDRDKLQSPDFDPDSDGYDFDLDDLDLDLGDDDLDNTSPEMDDEFDFGVDSPGEDDGELELDLGDDEPLDLEGDDEPLDLEGDDELGDDFGLGDGDDLGDDFDLDDTALDDEISAEDEEGLDLDGEEESEGDDSDDDEDYQGDIRTVRGANLVYKRATEDNTFEELWIYNIGKDMKTESKIRRAILAGTDIPPNATRSPDGSQRLESYSVGNVQYLNITGLPN